MAKVINTFTDNGTFTAPAGVKLVRVTAYKQKSVDSIIESCGSHTGSETVLAGYQEGSVTAIDVFGNAYAWGYNAYGQLGAGTSTPASSPVLVVGGLTFKSFGCMGSTSFGITPAGSLYAWGYNGYGQHGVGDLTTRSSPVAVLGGHKFYKCSVSNNSPVVFAITPAGTLYSWGYNVNGQLGLGDVTPRSSPVLVLGGLTWSSVPIAGDSALGLATSGTAYAWGYNAYGQLGLGDVAPRSSPVAVLGGLTWSHVSCDGSDAVLGVTTSGALYSWGYNSNGQLGLGDITSRSSPVAVLGSLCLGTAASTVFQTIPVVPGTSYSIAMQQFTVLFGTTPLGSVWGADTVTVEYDQ